MAFHIMLASKALAAEVACKLLLAVGIMSEDVFFHVVGPVRGVLAVRATMNLA